MAKDWYLINSLPVYNSGFEIDEFNNYAVDSFIELLETSPSAYDIEKYDIISDTMTKFKAIVQNNISDSVQKSIERQILIPIGSLLTGDYIIYENETWLVKSHIGNNKIYEKCIVELCNYILKFQHPISKEILSYPCIDDSSNLSGGVEISNILSDGNATKILRTTYDLNTILINTDQRFIIDDSSVDLPQVYKVTKPDRTSLRRGVKGLVELTLKQDKFDVNTDDRDMGICNYKSPSVEPINRGYSEIVTTDEEFIIYIGSYTELMANFYDNEGRKIEAIIPEWDVSSAAISSNDYTVSVNNNILKIQTKQSYSNIGKYIDVKLKNNNYESSVQLKIVM